MASFMQKTKLNGEILMLDREALARKKLFGIELYDLIDALGEKSKDNIITTPAIFKGVESQIKEPLEKCRADVRVAAGEQAELEEELTMLDVRREKISNKGGGIGQWMSNTGTEAKLKVRIPLLERDMKIRKENFGLEIWPIITAPTSITANLAAETKQKSGLSVVTGAIGGIGKGVKSGVSGGLGKLSKDEREVHECIEKAKADVTNIEKSIQRKQSLIDGLSK